MNWKNRSDLCFCEFKRNGEKIEKWLQERPDMEDFPSPCYFCIIQCNPEMFTSEFRVKMEDLPDIYCPECQIPRKSATECLQRACIENKKTINLDQSY